MGYALSWVAVRGKTLQALREEVGLQQTPEREELPESPLVGASLNGGWSLLLANRDHRFCDEKLLASLSGGCEAVACFVEEHVMVSRASGWKDGKRVWAAEHEGEKGLDHLSTAGALPEGFAGIRSEIEVYRREEGSCADHLFEVPVEVAARLTGFRHDEDPPTSESKPFEVLVEAPRRRSFFSKLFG